MKRLEIARHSSEHREIFTKDNSSKKNGPHATIYSTNGDRYIGSWENDMKHGKGTLYYKKNGFVYEGEFQNDMRSGFGNLCAPVNSEFFKNANKTNESLASSISTKPKKKPTSDHVELRKIYVGNWHLDKKHGFGINFYPDGSVYEGNWMDDMKEGWGRMNYTDGNIYEGEFHREKRHGQGVLLLENGDRYEGMWYDDLKEGPGKYVYLKKRQCLEGEWSKGMPKCGVLKDVIDHGKKLSYTIPKLELENPEDVLEQQREIIYEERSSRMMSI